MGTDAVFFARPEGPASPLGLAPRLAGWMATGHPDQTHVRAFLVHAGQLLGRRPPDAAGPLALRLDVGLPDDVRLLDQYALGRYLGPLVEWLGANGGWDFASAWATKGVADDTILRIGATEPDAEPAGDRRFTVRTTTAAGSPEFTEQVRAGLDGEPPLPGGAVSLQLSFAVPRGCHWAGLWQPTLDGLVPLLGAAADDRPEDAVDGRVVELGLHRQERDSPGAEVTVTGVARRLPERPTAH
ncbi:hypothetical protein GCU56_12840 [Geodermatophilus sabuli]|uniref:Uncharacterized protein n=1 Tax=Geodermatophilus sabuli TaxID=1564158 RepID=A0A7K3W1K6_9ACTN|nr:hypothetical protein [Geodermatophilus sabuli]NEK58755.1 hypothetical protein [Geodermatophilus sabuli]